MSPETNYSRIPEGMRITGIEEIENQLSEVALIGLQYSSQLVKETTLYQLRLNETDQNFTNYLSYVVFGRIIRFATNCPDNLKENCEALSKFREMGNYINKELKKTNHAMKDTDFSLVENGETLKTAFNFLDTDNLFDKLSSNQINDIRKLGSFIIPDNPKGDSDIKMIRHDMNY